MMTSLSRRSTSGSPIAMATASNPISRRLSPLTLTNPLDPATNMESHLMDFEDRSLPTPPSGAPPCAGCGSRHAKRTTLPDLCPCCAHPHDRHRSAATTRDAALRAHRVRRSTDNPAFTGCSVPRCDCKWPDAPPLVSASGGAIRIMREVRSTKVISVRGMQSRRLS